MSAHHAPKQAPRPGVPAGGAGLSEDSVDDALVPLIEALARAAARRDYAAAQAGQKDAAGE